MLRLSGLLSHELSRIMLIPSKIPSSRQKRQVSSCFNLTYHEKVMQRQLKVHCLLTPFILKDIRFEFLQPRKESENFQDTKRDNE